MPDRARGNPGWSVYRTVPGATIGLVMPIYEFRCETCGARLEGLVPAGTDSIPCAECGAERTARVLSTPGAPMHLVKGRGEARKQEQRNAQLQAGARSKFKEARRKAREAKNRQGGTGGAA
jgi:putative FmdB family regulatory protein